MFHQLFYRKPSAPHTGRLYGILSQNPLQHPGLCLGLSMSIIYTIVKATDDTSYKTRKTQQFVHWIWSLNYVVITYHSSNRGISPITTAVLQTQTTNYKNNYSAFHCAIILFNAWFRMSINLNEHYKISK